MARAGNGGRIGRVSDRRNTCRVAVYYPDLVVVTFSFPPFRSQNQSPKICSLESAIRSAVADVEKAGCVVERVWIEHDSPLLSPGVR